jgi:hypothetical protein
MKGRANEGQLNALNPALTYGALPPSSKLSFFNVELLCFINSFPTEVDPVKLIFDTSGLFARE